MALVTGCASGIGSTAAIALASAGATAIVTDSNLPGAIATAAAINEDGGTAYSRKLDVTSETEWNDTANWIESEIGRLDLRRQ